LAFGYLQLERDARDTHRRLVDEQAERRLADRAFDLMFDESSIGMATLSLSTESPGLVVGVNDALCQLVGRSEDELLDHVFAGLIHPDDRATSNSALRRAVAGRRTPIRSQPRLLRADGNPIQVQLTACPLLDDEDRPRYALLQIQDLSAQPTVIAPEAALDPLAAMPAGAPLDQAMQSTLDRIGRLNTAGVALVCDLDGLIAAADRGTEQILRRSVAGVLRQSLRGDDLIGRISQNRFVVLAEEVPSEHAETVARRITEALHERGLPVQIGISLLNPDSGDARLVVKRATSAMFGARAAGVPYQLYSLGDGVLYSSTEEEATVRRQVLYAKPGWREH
jgi:PAS domain S-box-containing protein/diguanylate cyclase (GGDEF)-like protein